MGTLINKLTPDSIIWVTRPPGQGENLCRLVESAGGRAISIPVIEIVPVRQQRRLSDLILDVQDAQLIIFVSKNAVQFAESSIPDFYRKIMGKRLLAIGEGTRAALHGKGFTDVTCPEAGIGSEALLELDLFQPETLSGKPILVVRGIGGRDRIARTMEQSGVTVKYLEVYARKKPDTDVKTMENIWHDTPPDAIVVTSVEGLNNLINMTPGALAERLRHTPLTVMSPRIQSVALSLGFTGGVAVAAQASDDGLLTATMSIFENRPV